MTDPEVAVELLIVSRELGPWGKAATLREPDGASMDSFADTNNRITEVADYNEVMQDVAEIDVSDTEEGVIGTLRVFTDGTYSINLEE